MKSVRTTSTLTISTTILEENINNEQDHDSSGFHSDPDYDGAIMAGTVPVIVIVFCVIAYWLYRKVAIPNESVPRVHTVQFVGEPQERRDPPPLIPFSIPMTPEFAFNPRYSGYRVIIKKTASLFRNFVFHLQDPRRVKFPVPVPTIFQPNATTL